MNSFLVFDPTKPDLRCEKCRWHTYLVLSVEQGISCMHSHAAAVIADTFPYIARENGNHWWGGGLGSQPSCLDSYKKIGGK